MRLEDLWKIKLQRLGWSPDTSKYMKFCWAESTLHNYNRMIYRFKVFCDSLGVPFPPRRNSVLADYMCELARNSDRPRGILNNSLAAITNLYRALDMPNPCDDTICNLQSALVKSQTSVARKRVNILPVEPFETLFRKWGDNTGLSTKQLRLKCVTLLAFAFMLRPSDIAPKGLHVQSENETVRMQFKRNQVKFPDEGGVTLTFLGTKNDSTRDGFCVTIPSASDPIIDPAQTLISYMKRTEKVAPHENSPVFVSLKKPYKGVNAQTVAKVLEKSIELAGLDKQLYSAKCFRPTGATRAVESGLDPDKVRRIGRWKTSSVFFEHYVHDRTPASFTDTVL